MTISEQMEKITEELISQNGIGYRISSQELKDRICARFGTNRSSIIPSDYCYNRVNKGIEFPRKPPRLFEFLGDGMYECFGKNYLYDKPVYAHPKGSKSEFVVGIWENGRFCSKY